jgi:ELWxxDGT repeat protein
MWRLFRVLVLLVLAFAWAPRVSAETAELVADINFTGGAPGSSPTGFTAVSRSGDAVIFGACDGSVRRVWRSDGTAAGTFALPGDAFSCASAEPRPVAAGGLAFYLARAASGKLHLWRTDGTAAGTFRITPDTIGPISELTVFGDGVAFRVGNRIWRADGSLLGTHPYALIPVTAVDPRFLIALGSRLFFVAEGLGNVNEQLWITDGTEAGTVPLTDFHTFAFDPETPPEMAQVGTTFFFVALDLLWATDGTAAGTAPVLSSCSTTRSTSWPTRAAMASAARSGGRTARARPPSG